jgi:hypothetical protein
MAREAARRILDHDALNFIEEIVCCAPQILHPVRREGARLCGWQSRVIKLARPHTGIMSRRRRSWLSTIRRLLCDVVTFVRLALTPRAQLAAENLFLRKQLALDQERHVKPRRRDPATHVILSSCSHASVLQN